jgi:preprotein translocase subunit Sec61beta
MGFKQERVSMPMASAGILGMAPDMKLSGIEFDPKSVIIATFVFTLAVKLAHAVARFL